MAIGSISVSGTLTIPSGSTFVILWANSRYKS
jgi:hypothetical protein